MKSLDLTGQKFNYLTVLERDYEKEATLKKKESYWKCRCDCGNIITARGSSLKKGTPKSCGCMRYILTGESIKNNYKDKAKEMIGKKFNKLTVLRLDENHSITNKNDNFYYICQCECGNIKSIPKRGLVNGTTISCGCYQKQKSSENSKKDITNQKFGLLTVIEMTNKRNISHGIICKCQCECGNIIEVVSTALRSGHTTSCGCIKSKGEQIINNLLISNQIPFTREKTFPDCIYPETNSKLKFDFFINNNFLLEFDGIQHFKSVGGWNTEKKVQQTQLRDDYKNQWAKENNIPLKRIPYWKLNDLTIEDIMSNKFLIT